jgi:tRNA(Arg) A34 adenosine deaminase TadA
MACIVPHVREMHFKMGDNSTHHYAIIIRSQKTLRWNEKIAVSTNANVRRGIMPSIHAKADIIKKVGKKRNIPKCVDIIVIRFSKCGVIGESRPCYHCILAMSRCRLNIKNIYYSTSDGTIVKESLSEMIKNIDHACISTGMKYHFKIQE